MRFPFIDGNRHAVDFEIVWNGRKTKLTKSCGKAIAIPLQLFVAPFASLTTMVTERSPKESSVVFPGPGLCPGAQVGQLLGDQFANLTVLHRLFLGEATVANELFDLAAHVPRGILPDRAGAAIPPRWGRGVSEGGGGFPRPTSGGAVVCPS